MQDRRIDRLLLKISQGDNDAFEDLYSLTSRGVFAFVYSYLKNYQDAEDVLQNTYLRIKLNAHRYKQGTNARAWILQIAKNLSLNAIAQRKPHEELTDSVPAPASPSKTEISDLINETLDDEERQILILHVLWGYKHREIAALLGCPVGTVTSKYKRSLSKMNTALTSKEVAE